ncbi:immunoglobulin-like domain-containing protein [Paenibacillus methanolicus]|uniref:Glycosyl hydrolase family 43 n=1 Tax=Paenibacillus methanolicus TaxID=582686 RepID=A0A5S5CIJ5_9BACL|nr:immunoglobulin-like domain-containing protein [Paenibacillus methanolicus]TYP79344.1 glycosyl hydrolase family 43 [Paenibacillus methanolicus]
MKGRKYVSLVMALLVTASPLSNVSATSAAAGERTGGTVLAAAAEMDTTGMILHYNMATSAANEGITTVPDLSGSGRGWNGIVRNPENGQLVKGADVGFAALSGGSSNSKSGYIEIPKDSGGQDVLSGLNAVTVSSLVNWDNDGDNRWIFGLGAVNGNIETGNKYFFVTPRHSTNSAKPVVSGISKAGWRNETLVKGTATLAANQWKLVTTVMSEASNTITLYVDGVEVASGAAGGVKLSELIDPTAAYSGFIGKSIFGNDPYYKGRVSDFRVYNRALTDTEVAALQTEASESVPKLNRLMVDDAAASLDVNSYLTAGDGANAVTGNLTLPTTGKHGVALSWTSSNTHVLANNGTVTRPGLDSADAQVTLTANLAYQGLNVSKSFTLTVLKQFSDEQRAATDAGKLSIPNPSNVKGNITLPTSGPNGTQITWVSSHPDIVKGSAQAASDANELGRVTRPNADTNATLTATVTKGAAKVERTFTLTVKKKPAAVQYDSYLFAYFTGEYEGGEEISFATAKDPLKWKALNNGQSIIQSKLGEKGLRDPFILRSAEGDKFYLLATDLKMGESTNFDQAQITGSHSIMIWESDDLVNWSEQRMVEVAPKAGGNTWAPEAFYDEKTGQYVVFWASSMKVADTYGKYANGRPTGQYNVMYYATTRDFYTFSEPKVYLDEAFPTIDTTMIQNDGKLYRFTKSEVNYKLYYEKAASIFTDKDGIAANGYQFDPIPSTKNGNQGLIGHAGNNEGPTVFKDLNADKWYMLLDSWPYHVRVSTNLEDGTQFANNLLPESSYALPPGPRHGTVIPISGSEYEALQAKYAQAGPTPSEQPVVHYAFSPSDVTDGVVEDVSGSGHDAKLVGGSSVNADDKVGEKGGSLALDGATGYLQLPNNLIKELNLEKMTFAAWVKTDANIPGQRIFDFASQTGRTANRNSMYLSTSGDTGKLEFAIVTPFSEKFGNDAAGLGDNYKYALRSTSFAAKEWHHVAVTMDDFDAVLYVDGAETARSSVFNMEPRMLMETTLNALGKSSRSGASLFKGKLDDFRIYNRALAPDEIEALQTDVDNTPEEPAAASLILRYDMNQIDGVKVMDQKGAFDGTWVNPAKAQWIHRPEAGALSFAGGAADSYIELPKGVLDGLTDVTISSLVNWKGEREAEWIFALGQDSNKYLFATPKRNSGDRSARAGLGITSWSNEAGANATTGSLAASEWKLVTVVVSGTEQTIKLYMDGVEVGSDSTKGYTLAQINNLTGRSGYIAKSFYASDPYFGGMIADFAVYDGALTAAEIAQLNEQAAAKKNKLEGLELGLAADALTANSLLGANTSENDVRTNLKLPTQGSYDTTISWVSSEPSIISGTGVVNRPEAEAGSQTVTLTATLSDGVRTQEKTFVFIVAHKPASADAVRMDAEALVVRNINDVRGNLTLPTLGANGSAIAWTSGLPSVVSATGEVTRPAHGSGDREVALTATISLGTSVLTKGFLAKVKELPQQEAYQGYAFTYFTGEGKSNGEQIYFALSQGNDPLHWRELNDGAPAITSELGEKGLRDPFLIRSPEGDKFYLIATDLRIYGNGDWTRAQTAGSRSIMVWESSDLVNWSEQRMVQVAPPEAGNTWAPEVIYDKTKGEYVVFWASKLYADEAHTGGAYQQMVYATTRDFHTFSEPKVYMDYGYSVIDTTMIEYNGNIYRFTKDERGNSAGTPNGKFVFQEVGDSVGGSFRLIKEGIGKGTIGQGEGPTVFKSNTENKWYMFIDEFGGRGYVPFETTDLASGAWTLSANYNLPASPRHGTVIPVTRSEYDDLSARVPAVVQEGDVPVTGLTLDPQSMELMAGEALRLQATVAPANATNKTVIWSSSNPAVARVDANGNVVAVAAGQASISGATADGAFLAVAEVKVEGSQPGADLDGADQAAAGQQIELIYGLKGYDGEVYAQDVTFTYDADRLTFQSVASSDTATFQIADYKAEAGKLRVLGVHLGENRAKPNRTVLKLAFTVKPNASPGIAKVEAGSLVVADSQGAETTLAGTSHGVQIGVVDKAALRTLLAEARQAHHAAVEGSGVGQYPAGSKAQLLAAITSAAVVADHAAATQTEVAEAAEQLASALQAFKASVHTSVPGDYNDDNRIGVGDLALMAKSYGMTAASEGWNEVKAHDLNNDGIIDIEDLVRMARMVLAWV